MRYSFATQQYFRANYRQIGYRPARTAAAAAHVEHIQEERDDMRKMKKIAILQSNYIPWKGYFDIIAAVDEFILYDDMQYTKNDWRNRNRIKTPKGLEWLTIPAGSDISRRIRDVELRDDRWQLKHWKTIVANYRKSAHFDEISEWLKPLYLNMHHTNLSQLNRQFIDAICNYLDIRTKISYSWEYSLTPGKSQRLVDLCIQTNAQEYISGPAAKGYLEESIFAETGIKITWFDYSNYSQHPQLWGDFTHEASILDLLFNCGKLSKTHMKHIKP